MDKYYYMVSQLPTLSFDKESPVTIDAFLEEAGKWLNRGDLRSLDRVRLSEAGSSEEGHRIWQMFCAFERRFRNDLRAWRLSRRGGDDLRFPSFPLTMVKEGNPLDVEKKLLRHRWDYIDTLESEHHFDLDFLILYYIKLQILQKLSSFDPTKGLDVFRAMVSDMNY